MQVLCDLQVLFWIVNCQTPGSSKCNMKDYPKREIELFKILNGRTETIETVPTKYQDLTFQKLFGYYGSKGIVLNQKTFIKNLGLLLRPSQPDVIQIWLPVAELTDIMSPKNKKERILEPSSLASRSFQDLWWYHYHGYHIKVSVRV